MIQIATHREDGTPKGFLRGFAWGWHAVNLEPRRYWNPAYSLGARIGSGLAVLAIGMMFRSESDA